MGSNACALDSPDRERRSVNRETMIRIILLFSLTFIDCTLVEERTPTYQAEEDDNITITLDSHIQSDASRTNMMCVFRSDDTAILYKMVRGVEDSESQHEQFAGRVQIDKDALRGRIRLHLSRLTAKDSGKYSCDLAADYNKVLRRWELETSEYFVLTVAHKSEVTPKSKKSGLTAAEGGGGKRRTENLKPVLQIFLLAIFVCLMGLGASGSVYLWRRTKENPDRANGMKLLLETEQEEVLFRC